MHHQIPGLRLHPDGKMTITDLPVGFSDPTQLELGRLKATQLVCTTISLAANSVITATSDSITITHVGGGLLF